MNSLVIFDHQAANAIRSNRPVRIDRIVPNIENKEKEVGGWELTVCDGVGDVVFRRVEAVRAEKEHVTSVGQLGDAGGLDDWTVGSRAAENLVGITDLVDTVASNLLLQDRRGLDRILGVAANTTAADSVSLLHETGSA